MFQKDAKVLLFHVEKAKQRKLGELCRKLQVGFIIVPRRRYGESLGALAGIVGFEKRGGDYQGEEFVREMLVFSGMDSDGLDFFLGKYKEAEISPISLKAVVTPDNIFWNAAQLYEELEKEEKAMRF